MKHLRFLMVAGFAVSAGAASGYFSKPYMASPQVDAESITRINPVWANDYHSLDAMTKDADTVVMATVSDTREGRTVWTSAGYALPFTEVDLVVDRTIRGTVEDVITLEQTGGTFDGGAVYIDGDQAYRVGDKVFLFLKAQPGTGMYYLSHPKGRFDVINKELVALSGDDAVAQVLNGRAVKRAIGLISNAK